MLRGVFTSPGNHPLAIAEPRYARARVSNRVEAREQSGRKAGASEERVFVRDGLRSYRRTYRLQEVYWGAAIAAGLLGVFLWVRHKGEHPDPSLYDMSAALAAGNAAPPAARAVGAERAPLADRGPGAAVQEPSRANPAPAPASEATSGAAERGPLPPDLAAGAFHEGKIGAYTPENLYVKIDGRAEYYLGFGLKGMHSVTLEAGSGSGASVEIELYDLGAARNALGCYNGERAPGAESTVESGSTFRFDRNAAFLTRGPYYARFVGSDETPEVVGEVKRLVELLRQKLPSEELPWAFDLFVDQLKLPASQVSYARENAFSFGFAHDVYKVSLSAADSQENMEAFVAVKADPAAASAMAKQFQDGFRSLGAAAGQTPAGVPLFKDEFLGSFSGATASDRWVFGVNSAPSAERAHQVLQQLEQGLHALPEAVRAKAQPAPEPAKGDENE